MGLEWPSRRTTKPLLPVLRRAEVDVRAEEPSQSEQHAQQACPPARRRSTAHSFRLMPVGLINLCTKGTRLHVSIACNLLRKRNCCCDQLDDEAAVTHCTAKSLNPRRHLLVPAPSGNRCAPSLRFSERSDSQRHVRPATTSFSTAVRTWTPQRADWVFVGPHVYGGLLLWDIQPPVALASCLAVESIKNVA